MRGRIPKDVKERLSPDQYDVCVNGRTEPPFSGRYLYCKDEGVYSCACCGEELFGSDTKFDSGSGWPSFWQALSDGKIERVTDTSLGMVRTEAKCRRCGSHLGHVFDDGPDPTGLRYCINSLSLDFRGGSR